MRLHFVVGVVLSLNVLAHPGDPKGDFPQAPPSFSSDGKLVIPIDIQRQDLTLEFDITNQKAIGKSRIEFTTRNSGYPYFDLIPNPTWMTLGGESVTSQVIPTPDNATKVRMVNQMVAADAYHTMDIEYVPSSSTVSFSSGGVRMVWAMSDVSADRGFLERYAPANLEFDPFPMTMKVKLIGATATHQVFSNGKIQKLSDSEYAIDFPQYFTTSSFFFHITDKSLNVVEEVHPGVAASIPVTVYGESSSSVAGAMEKTHRVLTELENTYGPFAHEKVVVYLTSSGGGMEHCGATITSSGALAHELTHSWFARGVMPSSGNSGWMDEAIASWRDNGYPKASGAPNRPPVNLAAFSPYKRDTTYAAYSDGARFMSELDYLFAKGLRPALREVFGQLKRTTITTPQFEKLVGELSNLDVSPYFKRYVYNQSAEDHLMAALDFMVVPQTQFISLHPRPLTQEDIERIR